MASFNMVGHDEQMQFLSRVKEGTVTVYGEKRPRGTVCFLRQDFDTVENPFAFSITDRVDPAPRAGVHFIGCGPSAQHFEKQHFEKLRLEMDLEMDGVEHRRRYDLPEENVGFTTFLVTTHRQILLLPPRAHRSSPLAEMI